jgi:hypothetical protein
MSDTILSGDFTVYYSAENGQRRIQYTGAGTKYTVRQLYSALQDLFDELNQMDDRIPMTAQTPTEFTLVNGWFIDQTSTEFLTGGAITTNGWAGNNIVQIEYTDTVSLVAGDIGRTIVTGSNGYSGTILDYNDTGATQTMYIRPDDPSTDLFSAAETFTITGGTGAGSVVAASNLTGEQLWANIYTIGSIADNALSYVVQNGELLSAYKATTDWWEEGQIDILVLVRQMGTEIDDGTVRVYQRRGASLYDHFEVDLSNGGRNPIPLATAEDTLNDAGFRQMVLTTVVTGFEVGDVITDDSDGTVQGVVTSVSGTVPNQTIQYYLIGDPLSDFTGATGAFTGSPSGATATAVAPTDVNGAGAAADAITITHTAITRDLNNGNGSRPYSIEIDCNGQDLSLVYQALKYITRRGETTTTRTDGQQGQQYIGPDRQVEYNTQAGGAWAEGSLIYLYDTGNTLVAQGTIVADHDDGTTGDVVLRDTRFFTTGTITKAGDADTFGGSTVTANVSTVRTINPTKQSPFGTFAGGTLFGAPGVWLTNFSANQSYQLIDDNGVTQIPPNTVSINVTNTRLGDRIGVFRIDGSGNIIKNEYNATVQTAGSGTLVVNATISNEAPADGTVRVVDVSAAHEWRLRYSSFSGTTFTLANTVGTATGGTQTQLTDTGASFLTTARVGDLVYNSTEGTYAYVTSVDSNTQLTTTNTGSDNPVTDWNGDGYELNALPAATTTSDTVYVPFLDIYETAGTDGVPGSEFSQIIYSTNIDIVARVRQAGVILPFEQSSAIGSNGVNISTIRSPDSIYQ